MAVLGRLDVELDLDCLHLLAQGGVGGFGRSQSGVNGADLAARVRVPEALSLGVLSQSGHQRFGGGGQRVLVALVALLKGELEA